MHLRQMGNTPANRYQRAEQVTESQVGDRIVLYHTPSRKALTLNPVGSLLWSLLESPRSDVELASHLADRYPGLEWSQAHADVLAYLQQLLAQEVIFAVA
jgi:hypothetical protein